MNEGYRNPLVTVDIIIEIKGGIVLIERKNPPLGWALPGGFVDYGESLEQSAKREAREETSLDVILMEQFHTYSSPDRDPRRHTITTVYIARSVGNPKASDDAKNAALFKLGFLPERIAFDHRKILMDYFHYRQGKSMNEIFPLEKEYMKIALDNLGPNYQNHQRHIENGVKIHKPSGLSPDAPSQPGGIDENDENDLFLKAMAGVKPISNRNIIKAKPRTIKNNPSAFDEEKEGRNCLMRLVRQGDGFNVAGTPEYMEGVNYTAHPELTKRLHKGEFSIQAHIDLHGMTVAQATLTFDTFLKRVTSAGLRGLLIIHGRGLSSPGKPILKLKVHEWLTSGPWRKWVIAFSSARPCDGGAGATYVLLRKSPATKQHRKNQLKLSNNS
jgi:8-oxo-dGTP diphosphatase